MTDEAQALEKFSKAQMKALLALLKELTKTAKKDSKNWLAEHGVEKDFDSLSSLFEKCEGDISKLNEQERTEYNSIISKYDTFILDGKNAVASERTAEMLIRAGVPVTALVTRDPETGKIANKIFVIPKNMLSEKDKQKIMMTINVLNFREEQGHGECKNFEEFRTLTGCNERTAERFRDDYIKIKSIGDQLTMLGIDYLIKKEKDGQASLYVSPNFTDATSKALINASFIADDSIEGITQKSRILTTSEKEQDIVYNLKNKQDFCVADPNGNFVHFDVSDGSTVAKAYYFDAKTGDYLKDSEGKKINILATKGYEYNMESSEFVDSCHNLLTDYLDTPTYWGVIQEPEDVKKTLETNKIDDFKKYNTTMQLASDSIEEVMFYKRQIEKTHSMSLAFNEMKDEDLDKVLTIEDPAQPSLFTEIAKLQASFAIADFVENNKNSANEINQAIAAAFGKSSVDEVKADPSIAQFITDPSKIREIKQKIKDELEIKIEAMQEDGILDGDKSKVEDFVKNIGDAFRIDDVSDRSLRDVLKRAQKCQNISERYTDTVMAEKQAAEKLEEQTQSKNINTPTKDTNDIDIS